MSNRGGGATKGPISQRDLIPLLKTLIDDASAKGPSAHRDVARAKLRQLLDTANWRTPHVYHNLSSRRCRYLNSIGYWVPSHWTLLDWKTFPRTDHGDPGE